MGVRNKTKLNYVAATAVLQSCVVGRACSRKIRLLPSWATTRSTGNTAYLTLMNLSVLMLKHNSNGAMARARGSYCVAPLERIHERAVLVPPEHVA
jgi:hypothetical protein